MNIRIALLALTLLSITSNTFPSYIAKVTQIKGRATVLLPKSKEAKNLSVGDQLFEDSSLLTYNSSYLQITFIDDSVMNIGSQSKLVLTKFDNQSKHKIANLIKGQLRTYIKNEPKKQKKKRVKFIIGTKTAALGVRGTEFETIYNEKSNATTLLTYNGEVLIKKKEKISSISSKKKETLSFNNLVNSIEKESTVVSEGKYLGVTETQKEIAIPIKISPVQFSLLKNKNIIKKEVSKIARVDSIKSKDDFENKTLPGGFIDFATGIYIAPTSGSKFNEKLQVFETKEIGRLNEITGEYVPPKGMKLDAREGFIVTDKKDEKLIKLQQKLNKGIKRIAPPLKPIIPNSWFNIDKHYFSAGIGYTKRNFKHKDLGIDLTSNTGTAYDLRWQQKWNEDWTSILGLRLYNFSYMQPEEFKTKDVSLYQYANGYFQQQVGIKYNKNEYLYFILLLTVGDNEYLDEKISEYDLVTIDGYEKYATALGIGRNFHLSKKFIISGEFNLKIIAPMNDNYEDSGLNLEYSSKGALGFKALVDATYKYSKSLNIGLMTELHSMNQLITNNYIDSNDNIIDNSFEVDKSVFNIMLKLGWNL